MNETTLLLGSTTASVQQHTNGTKRNTRRKTDKAEEGIKNSCSHG